MRNIRSYLVIAVSFLLCLCFLFSTCIIHEVKAWGIFPAFMSGGPKSSIVWNKWDESEEAVVATDRIFCMKVANTNANGDETATGFNLSSADLTFTCANIAGVSGYTRQTAANSSFTVSERLLDKLFSGGQFTIVWKVEDFTATLTTKYLSNIIDADSQGAGYIWQQSGANLRTTYQGGGEDDIGSNPQTSGVVYIALWKARGGNCFLGYKNGGPKPTKVSDFTDTLDTGDGSMPNISANWTSKTIIGGGGDTSVLRLHYIVGSMDMLFD